LNYPKFKEPIKIYKDKGGLTFDVSKLGTTTVSKTKTNRYFISCLVDEKTQPDIQKPINSETTIGIDLGIKHFCIASNGSKVDNPKYYSKAMDKLAVNQVKLSRKYKKPSNKEDLQSKRCQLPTAKAVWLVVPRDSDLRISAWTTIGLLTEALKNILLFYWQKNRLLNIVSNNIFLRVPLLALVTICILFIYAKVLFVKKKKGEGSPPTAKAVGFQT